MKEKILKSLFESNKTTGELLVSLGYEKTKYNTIDKDLKRLVAEGLIFADKRKNMGSCGQPPTFYGVVCELPTLQKTHNEYSSLRSAMQKNDNILEMLVKRQLWMIDYEAELEKKKAEEEAEISKYLFDCDGCVQLLHEPDCGEGEQQRQKCIEFSKNPKPCIPINPEWEAFKKEREEQNKKDTDEVQNQLKTEFKNRLRLSPSFFEYCLINEPEELKKQFDLIYSFTVDSHLEKHPVNIFSFGKDAPGEGQWAYFTKIFEICVFHDIMKKEASEEAVKSVLEMNRYKAHVLEDRKRLDIFTYHNNPALLNSLYEQEWVMRRPKLESVRVRISPNRRSSKYPEASASAS